VTTYGTAYPTSKCTSLPDDTVPVYQDCTGRTPPQAILLHEGNYRLMVLADGSPLRITLTLHGLDGGTTSLTPVHQLYSAQAALVQRETVQDKVVTFGGSVPVAQANYAWVLAALKGRGSGTLDGVESCARSDNGQPSPYAFAPGCPGGYSRGSDYEVHVGGQTMGRVTSYVGPSLTPNATTMSLGGSVSGDNGRTFQGGLGVWMRVP
jgi:hypothetical protein